MSDNAHAPQVVTEANALVISALGAHVFRDSIHQWVQVRHAHLSGQTKIGDFQVVTTWMSDQQVTQLKKKTVKVKSN